MSTFWEIVGLVYERSIKKATRVVWNPIRFWWLRWNVQTILITHSTSVNIKMLLLAVCERWKEGKRARQREKEEEIERERKKDSKTPSNTFLSSIFLSSRLFDLASSEYFCARLASSRSPTFFTPVPTEIPIMPYCTHSLNEICVFEGTQIDVLCCW